MTPKVYILKSALDDTYFLGFVSEKSLDELFLEWTGGVKRDYGDLSLESMQHFASYLRVHKDVTIIKELEMVVFGHRIAHGFV